MNAEDFWKPWEGDVSSFDDAMSVVHGVFEQWSSKGRVFAWRGLVNAGWALHSSLYRRLLWTTGAAAAPKEADLQVEENRVLTDVNRWGLHAGEHGRLSVLSQLALLQHYGAPTRLIDVTFNPFIGLWFAVEEQWDNGVRIHEDVDGRLFAIDVTNSLINDEDGRRAWADDLGRPWPAASGKASDLRKWTTATLAWWPPRLDQRISAQNGAFLLGGVPSSGSKSSPRQWPKGPGAKAGWWTIDEVRRAVSVPVRVHKIGKGGPGADPENPVYTLRVKSSAKEQIRRRLQDLYGYKHSTIYPDYSGFARFATPRLKSKP